MVTTGCFAALVAMGLMTEDQAAACWKAIADQQTDLGLAREIEIMRAALNALPSTTFGPAHPLEGSGIFPSTEPAELHWPGASRDAFTPLEPTWP